ncbi:MAG TPA: DegV family protein [Candidatus Limnocylindrales bacterium]
MARVAIVTDSASDMDPGRAAELGITIVPLAVSFGEQTYKANVDLSADDFWVRMTAPDAPFPKTATTSPGDFVAAYQQAFDKGADAVVSVHVAATLSGTMAAAKIAKDTLADREIHLVDSTSASLAEGFLCELGLQLASQGVSAAEIARILLERTADLDVFIALDTLEYLKRGGRISGAQAAIGTLLSVKPIITIAESKVEASERVRTRSKARERVLELLTQKPVERLAILYAPPGEPESFRDEVIAAMPGGVDPAGVVTQVIGPSVGPHVGPGCIGGVVLYRH